MLRLGLSKEICPFINKITVVLNTKISYLTVKMVNILWYNILVNIIHF